MDNDVGRTSRWAKELRRRPASGRGSPWISVDEKIKESKKKKKRNRKLHANILEH
jgi:hypothetical protein